MPRSRHVDAFNHDEEAAGYDRDVGNEDDPIRAGYAALLDWIVERARIDATSRVVELGSGTGNLTARLPRAREIVCVDVSTEMTSIARAKLGGRSDVRFEACDLLEWFDRDLAAVDAIVSSYAIHHLTDDEKADLFGRMHARVVPGGRLALGDLMFETAADRAPMLEKYRDLGRPHVAEGIEEEFFWDLARAREELGALGFEVETQRFSDLSWGVAATRRA